MNIKFKHLALACMMGLGLVGCGSSDSDDPPKPAEVMLEKQISAYIQSAQGVALDNVSIQIAGKTFKTNASGLAEFKLSLPQTTKNVVVELSRAGFINQSILVDVKDLANITANLLQIKQTVTVAQIQDAQVIESAYQNARITIPANAFVKADMTPATGAVTVEFTPWDIRTDDLSAMPANGVALNAAGEVVNLISAGMITAIFKDANGNRLQLANGKKADIQMDLPLKSINKQNLTVGSEIPMWHFNESKGLWLEEGKGHVIASDASSTGLAVHASVSHFSTWNWDFEFGESAGQVHVKCMASLESVPCHVTAIVELTDGSSFSKSASLSETGSTIINMPSTGSIHWTARDSTGTLIGKKTSGVNGNVIIDLGQPTSNNLVKCVTANQAPVACSGTVNGLAFSVPKEGGRILTGLQNANLLTWSAQSEHYAQGQAVYQSTGTKTSNSTENVTIVLNQTEKLFDQMLFKLRCDSTENASNCAVKLNGGYYVQIADSDYQFNSISNEFTIPLNQYVTVYLPIPPKENTDSVYLDGHASILINGLKRQTRYGLEDVYETQEFRFKLDEAELCDPSITWQQDFWDDVAGEPRYPNGYPPCDRNEMPT